MKTTPPRTPTGSISCCLGLIKNLFSIAQTMNTECAFNMKYVHKIVGGKAPSSPCHVFYVYIQKYLPGLAIYISMSVLVNVEYFKWCGDCVY